MLYLSLIHIYGLDEPLPMEYASRKITLPKEAETRKTFSVRRDQIDTNEHVNNCQYVQMALEVLEEEIPVRQLRVEYKKSAVYGSEILPKVALEAERTVVEPVSYTHLDVYKRQILYNVRTVQ